MWIRLVVAAWLGALAGGRRPVGHNLVVLLLDGFGSALLNRTDLDATFGLRHLAENGVLVDRLRPAYPTQSLPNWHSLATGLNVENHGFTSDYMFDEISGLVFERGQGINDSDEIWWAGRPDPVWYTAGKAGIDVHCYWFSACHV
jgi:ectonucleotide pyrophosphatase/phosphodiesterase family protein 6